MVLLNVIIISFADDSRSCTMFYCQRAYYFGSRLLVEVDIVLPEDITLKEAHDIGESLQNQIERLENVERVSGVD